MRNDNHPALLAFLKSKNTSIVVETASIKNINEANEAGARTATVEWRAKGPGFMAPLNMTADVTYKQADYLKFANTYSQQRAMSTSAHTMPATPIGLHV